MPRKLDDWLKSYMEYTAHLEAPSHYHWWTGVSTIAAVLRRHVWFDQGLFRWYPNFYIILVAPPGVVQKSTTIKVGYDLLKGVIEMGDDQIYFGPESVTWQALMQIIERSMVDTIDYEGQETFASCINLPIGELGTFLDTKESGMIDHLVSLWDNKEGRFEKSTKNSGDNTILNPWINIIAGTTPDWIKQNLSDYVIGGGFASRTIFTFADKKRHHVAYPKFTQRGDTDKLRKALIEDLYSMGQLRGEMGLTREAFEWGTKWYSEMFDNPSENLKLGIMQGYLARKQTHVHKIAMVISAAQSDEMLITKEHLVTANSILNAQEAAFVKVLQTVSSTPTMGLVKELFEFLREHKRVMKFALINAFCDRYELRVIDQALTTLLSSRRFLQKMTESQQEYYELHPKYLEKKDGNEKGVETQSGETAAGTGAG